jgi:hypothetical protein
MSTNDQNAIPLACDLSAIDAAERERHVLTAKELFGAVLEVHELPDGYAFRLPLDNVLLQSAAEWIANERLCCPFFSFSLKVEPQSTALWVALTGDEDVKAFIRAEFGSVLNEAVSHAAGLS